MKKNLSCLKKISKGFKQTALNIQLTFKIIFFKIKIEVFN